MKTTPAILTVMVAAMMISPWSTAGAFGDTVAYWSFEEGVADAAAVDPESILDSANGLDGTPFHGPVYRTAFTPGGGVLGLDFGVDTRARVFVPDVPALALTGSMTIEAFIVLYETAPRHSYIMIRADDRNGLDPYGLQIQATGKAAFNIRQDSSNESTVWSAEPIPTGDLVHRVRAGTEPSSPSPQSSPGRRSYTTSARRLSRLLPPREFVHVMDRGI